MWLQEPHSRAGRQHISLLAAFTAYREKHFQVTNGLEVTKGTLNVPQILSPSLHTEGSGDRIPHK